MTEVSLTCRYCLDAPRVRADLVHALSVPEAKERMRHSNNLVRVDMATQLCRPWVNSFRPIYRIVEASNTPPAQVRLV